jgi:hypothetical protein
MQKMLVNCINKLDTCQLFLGKNKSSVKLSVFAGMFFFKKVSFFWTHVVLKMADSNAFIASGFQ